MKHSRERFLVFGAGAVGSVLGGFLRGAGHDVVLLGRARHMDAIACDGLNVEGIWGTHQFRGFETAVGPSELSGCPAPGWILVTVKSYDTELAARIVADLLAAWPETRVVSLQNGLGNIETLEDACGRPVLAGRVITGAEVTAPGSVRVTVTADCVRIGEPGLGATPDARRLARLFRQAGVPAASTHRVEQYLWAKIVYNCALNAPATLLDCVYGDLLHYESTRRLMRDVVREVYDVAGAEGIALQPASAEAYARHLFRTLIPRTAAHPPSMLQDVRLGRRTEIDALNGAVAARAERLGLRAPVNAAIADLVRARATMQNQRKGGR